MTTVCQQGLIINGFNVIFRLWVLFRHVPCCCNYMQTSYFTIGAIILLALALVIWLVIRNLKDEKDFEKDNIDSSLVEPKDPEIE